MTFRIAHLTAHAGGGVGSVLRDFFHLARAQGVENRLFCLDRCEDTRAGAEADSFVDECHRLDHDVIRAKVGACDAVLLHFWNHPLTAAALHGWDFRSWPTVVWAHNSGLHAPHLIPSYLGGLTRALLFSSACSFEIPNRADLSCALDAVHSSCSLTRLLEIGRRRLIASRARKLLYVGTVSGEKMHPGSAAMFAALSRQGFLVRVVGGTGHAQLAQAVQACGGVIDAVGPVADVEPHYRWADAFVYPLRPGHYGTGEQVILEAMAAGLPIVAFGHPAERAIVQDDVTGCLVESEADFIEVVIGLAQDPVRRARMASQALDRVGHEFDATRMVTRIVGYTRRAEACGAAAAAAAEVSVRPRDLGLFLWVRNALHDESLHSAVAREGELVVPRVLEAFRSALADPDQVAPWTSPTKSTPFHYLRYFPESAGLQRLCVQIQAEVARHAYTG
jgi:glycosyltransferase involved in cell wall biosynthesis